MQMDDALLHNWSMTVPDEGMERFAAQVSGFPYQLADAVPGSIGKEDFRLVDALGIHAGWLDDTDVQDRLRAVLLYQTASIRPTQIPAPKGRPVVISNPLFRAVLLADIEKEGERVTCILADAARGQDDYLTLRGEIPEWCELRIYQLSSASTRGIHWLPRNKAQKRRRVAAIRAASRG